MRIYVGNLAYSASAEELKQAFAQHGEVKDVFLPTDRDRGRPKGFAFVEMPDEAQAKAAIAALNGQEFKGRKLTVTEARAREEGGRRREPPSEQPTRAERPEQGSGEKEEEAPRESRRGLGPVRVERKRERGPRSDSARG